MNEDLLLISICLCGASSIILLPSIVISCKPAEGQLSLPFGIYENQEEEWRLEAQRSQKKIKELEKEIVQGRARLEEGKSHAVEQSQLLLSSGSTLGPGNTLGYTLVLQPLVRNNVSNWCGRCSFPSDADSCTHCGDQCQGLPEDKNPTCRFGGLPHAATATTPVDNNATCTAAWGSLDKPPSPSKPIASPRTSSPFRDCTTETWALDDSHRKRCENGSPQRTPSSGISERDQVERVDCSRNLEVERCLSQKWFKQRPTNLKSSPSRCDHLLADQIKHATPLSTRTGRGLMGSPSFRVPSSSPCEQRSPLTGLNPNAQLKRK